MIANDTQVVPDNAGRASAPDRPDIPFSQRQLIECLRTGAARVRLDDRGIVTVETDMTDIGTGSYTIIGQTAAEMMGVPLAPARR